MTQTQMQGKGNLFSFFFFTRVCVCVSSVNKHQGVDYLTLEGRGGGAGQCFFFTVKALQELFFSNVPSPLPPSKVK